MKPTDLAKHLIENEDEFSAEDYVKSGGDESAVEIYDGPIVRIIRPLSVFTLNDYLYDDKAWNESEFQYAARSPLYVVFDHSGGRSGQKHHDIQDRVAILNFESNTAWNIHSGRHSLRDVKDMLSEAAYSDMQSGFVQYFQSQIAAKKDAKTAVTNLVLLGRHDLAVNYSRYLSRSNLPMGHAIAASLAMKKAGKRSRNKIARFMKDQSDIKWGENGFYLLFDDWIDTAPFFGESHNYDYKKNAEKIFSGEARDWFDAWSYVKPDEIWSSIDDRNNHHIRQLLIGRECYNTDGEQNILTKEFAMELSDEEVGDIVCDRGNSEGPTEDIFDAVKQAGVYAAEDAHENAYTEGYQDALVHALGGQKDKSNWINVPDGKGGKKQVLAFFVPYTELEAWIKQWKDDNGEDEEFDGSVMDLALTYVEKATPNEDYSGDTDDEYFNQQLRENLGEIDMVQPERAVDPDQPELPLEGEPDPNLQVEPEFHSTVHVGQPPSENVYKGVPDNEAKKYARAVPNVRLTSEAIVAKLLERDEQPKSEFHRPENFDCVKEGPGWKMYAGANDWEIGHSGAAVYFIGPESDSKRIWIDIKHPTPNDTKKSSQDEDAVRAHGKEAVNKWISVARKLNNKKDEHGITTDWQGAFTKALSHEELAPFIAKHGADQSGWSKTMIEGMEDAIDVIDPKEFVTSGPQWVMKAGDRYLWCSEDGSSGTVTSDPAQATRFNSEQEAMYAAERLDFLNKFSSYKPGPAPVAVQESIDPKEFVANFTYRFEATYKDAAGQVQTAFVTGFNAEDAIQKSIVAGILDERDAGAVYAVKQVASESLQESAQQLDEQIYKLSTTQIDLPDDIGQHIISWGKLNIPDDALYVEDDGGCGRESEQHISVLYGLTDAEPTEALSKIIGTTKPFMIEIGGTSIFENEKYDVVKLDVISEELTNLSNAIRKACPNKNKFPDYHGHVTVAYVKPGRGKEFSGMDVFKAAQVPRDFWAYDVLFKGAGDSEDGNRVVEILHFNKRGDPGHEEPANAEQRFPQADPEKEEEKKEDAEELALAEAQEDDIDPKEAAAGAQIDPHPDWRLFDRKEDPNGQLKQNYRHKNGRVTFKLLNTFFGNDKAPFSEDWKEHWSVYVYDEGGDFMDGENFEATTLEQAETTAVNLAFDMVHSTAPSLFQPRVVRPGRVRENEVDPKEFVADVDVPYFLRCIGMGTIRYSIASDGAKQASWTVNAKEATPYDVREAVNELAYWQESQPNMTFDLVPAGDYAVDVGESEIDPKEFVQAKVASEHKIKVDGAGYACTCGGWGYNTTGDSSGAIARAMAEFRRHKRQHRLKPVRESGTQYHGRRGREDDSFTAHPPVDPKEFAATVSRPSELGCPECHGHNLSQPDEENLVDCFDCGIWFNPTHPNNLAENVDPKEFVAEQGYLVRTGIGAQTRYLQRRDGQAFFIDDPDEATVMMHEDAVRTVDALHAFRAYADARIEMAENDSERWQFESGEEIDAKEYADETPYECAIRKNRPRDGFDRDFFWNAETACWSQEQGNYTVFPDRKSAESYLSAMCANLPTALKTFDGASVVPALTEGEIDPKEYADETTYPFVIQNKSEPSFFWRDGHGWTAPVLHGTPTVFGSREEAQAAFEAVRRKPGVGAHGIVVPASMLPDPLGESGPLEDDDLPGEVTSFLRNVRRKRKKAKAKPVL